LIHFYKRAIHEKDYQDAIKEILLVVICKFAQCQFVNGSFPGLGQGE